MHLSRLIILFFCWITIPLIAQATPFPDAAIKHETIPYFIAEERSALDAQLNDSEKIAAARCYYKTDLDNNYLYVAMDHLLGNNYQCVLPALSNGSQTLEYFFLIVNSSGQVIRSISYVTTKDASSTLPEGRSTVDYLSTLYVYSELGDMEIENTAIIDGRTNLLTTQHSNQLYGLRAGVYEQANIPDHFDAMPGYFGGFIQNRVDKTIRPIKGFAPNLKTPADHSTTFQETRMSSSTAPPKTSEQTSPPDIAGTDWSGYYKITDGSYNQSLTASIEQAGFSILLITTKSGLGHYLTGSINTAGDMYMRDMEDGQIWTSHFGPATSTKISIYDYVQQPDEDNPDPPFHKIKIVRPPSAPLGISASDGTFKDKVHVSWNESSGTTYYVLYSCSSDVTDSCSFVTTGLSESYEDTRGIKGKIYYRIRSCNEYGCSQYSEYDIGYLQQFNITPLIQLLLLKR